ncbi:MAG: tRNA (adenosine(37)-N6)-threonylcarbamoyltransferase complex ATPase subunit type 1 TsaE [Cyanobacteria bacterium J06621_12]
MTQILLPTLEDTLNFGCLLGKHLPPGSTLLLEGNLGAGKTTLVQGIARGLEIAERVVSPTFTLINEYLDGRIPLYHLDLYRLEPSQVNSIYPEIYWLGQEVEPGITAIEWSQRLSIEPKNYIKIELTDSGMGRKISLQPSGKTTDLKFIQSFCSSTQ